MGPRTSVVPDSLDACAQLVVDVLASGDNAAAAQWLDLMAAKSKSLATKPFYHALLRRCAATGKTWAAAWCVERMTSIGMAPNIVTFNTLLNCGAKVGDLTLVEKWFADMKSMGLEPNAVSYNTLISACAQAQNGARAEHWFGEMVAHGIQPCQVTFGAVIDAFAKKGSVREAEAWAKKMCSAGVPLDGVAYNSLISACGKAGDLARAEYWLNHMMTSGVKPNEKVYNSLIHAFGKASDLAGAESWFARMRVAGSKPDMISYSSMIYAAAKVGNTARAEGWMEEMIREGFTPNTICYNTLLHACARHGDIKTAATWILKMLELGLKPTKITFNSMIDACVSGKHAKDAEFWLQQMVLEGFHPDDITLSTLARWGAGEHSSSGSQQRAKDLPKWAYSAMINAYTQRGESASASRWQMELAASSARGPPRHLASAATAAPSEPAPFGGAAGSPACSAVRTHKQPGAAGYPAEGRNRGNGASAGANSGGALRQRPWAAAPPAPAQQGARAAPMPQQPVPGPGRPLAPGLVRGSPIPVPTVAPASCEKPRFLDEIQDQETSSDFSQGSSSHMSQLPTSPAEGQMDDAGWAAEQGKEAEAMYLSQLTGALSSLDLQPDGFRSFGAGQANLTTRPTFEVHALAGQRFSF